MRTFSFYRFFLTIILFILLFSLSPFHVKTNVKDSLQGEEVARAIVKKVSVSSSKSTQTATVLVTEGKEKDKIFTLDNSLTIQDKPLLLKPNDSVLLLIDTLDNGNLNITIYEYVREKELLYLILFFALLVLITGGIKGLNALTSVLFTICVIYTVLLPGLLCGYNPINLTIISSLIIAFFSLFIQNGLNKKTVASFFGTLGGIIIVSIVTYIMSNRLQVYINSEEFVNLSKLPQSINFNFQAILFSSIMIGALGANIDMSMSVSSAMNEIKESNKNISKLEFFKSGMNVGRDVIGTMCNTLILAYVGGSLVSLMIFMAYNTSFTYIINLQDISLEILRSFAGSIGIILSVPITVAVRVFMDTTRKSAKTRF